MWSVRYVKSAEFMAKMENGTLHKKKVGGAVFSLKKNPKKPP